MEIRAAAYPDNGATRQRMTERPDEEPHAVIGSGVCQGINDCPPVFNSRRKVEAIP